jgi:hypothetical protein
MIIIHDLMQRYQAWTLSHANTLTTEQVLGLMNASPGGIGMAMAFDTTYKHDEPLLEREVAIPTVRYNPRMEYFELAVYAPTDLLLMCIKAQEPDSFEVWRRGEGELAELDSDQVLYPNPPVLIGKAFYQGEYMLLPVHSMPYIVAAYKMGCHWYPVWYNPTDPATRQSKWLYALETEKG